MTKKPSKRRDPNTYPPGWDAKSIAALAKHYDEQTDDDAIAEAARSWENSTMMGVPKGLVPQVRELIFKHQSRH